MAKRIFDLIKTLLPLIGLGIFGYLIYSLGFENILYEIQRIPPIIILVSLLLTLPRVIIRNSAWMLIHKQQHIQVSFWRSLKIFLMGYFYGSFTPGYVGQLMRVPYLKEHTNEPYGKLFVNSFLETTIHLLSMYALMFIGAILIIQDIPEVFYVVLIWIIAVVIFLWVFVKKERGEKILIYLGRTIVFRILFFVPTHWKTSSKKFVKTFYHDFPSVKSLLPPLLITSTTWILSLIHI